MFIQQTLINFPITHHQSPMAIKQIKTKNNKTVFKPCDWPIENLPGLSLEELLKLQSCNITTTLDLLQQAKTPEAKLALASKLEVNLQYVNKWIALADMARIPSVGMQYCGLLLHAGVISVLQLAEIPSHRLHHQIIRLQVATLQRRDLCPAVELVQQWSQQAKILVNT